MKKFWMVILTIYTTLVTIGCFVFGFLYFKGKSNDNTTGGGKLSANALLCEVCYDLGLLDRPDAESALSAATLTAAINDVQTYAETATFDEEGIKFWDMPSPLNAMMAQLIVYSKNMTELDEAGQYMYKPHTYYNITGSMHIDPDEPIGAGIYFYYTFDNYVYKTSFVIGDYDSETQKFVGSNQVDIKITQPEDADWRFELAIYDTESDLMIDENRPEGTPSQWVYINVRSADHAIYFGEFCNVLLKESLSGVLLTDHPENIDLNYTSIDANKKTIERWQKFTFSAGMNGSGEHNDFTGEDSRLINMANDCIRSCRNVGRTKLNSTIQYTIGSTAFFTSVDRDMQAMTQKLGYGA